MSVVASWNIVAIYTGMHPYDWHMFSANVPQTQYGPISIFPIWSHTGEYSALSITLQCTQAKMCMLKRKKETYVSGKSYTPFFKKK